MVVPNNDNSNYGQTALLAQAITNHDKNSKPSKDGQAQKDEPTSQEEHN